MSLDKQKKKGKRITISNEEDFYNLVGLDKDLEIAEYYNVDISVINNIKDCFNLEKVSFKVKDVNELLNYSKIILEFENEYNKLLNEISHISKIEFNRIEYNREHCIPEDLSKLKREIDEFVANLVDELSEEEENKLLYLEKEIDKLYLYSKDIELLKNIMRQNSISEIEKYNEKSKIKSRTLEIKSQKFPMFLKQQKGSVEYFKHISSYIPRMKRLRKSLKNYLYEIEAGNYRINQSEALQDSINIALVYYNNIEFKAISGSNEILDYCKAPHVEEQKFKSRRVNRLGDFGIGYNRVNDSEKKILEKIHRLIEEKKVKDNGDLVLLSMLEPCPSCYSVIHQFSKLYPNIKINIKFKKSYG